jgi:hypothetical protein
MDQRSVLDTRITAQASLLSHFTTGGPIHRFTGIIETTGGLNRRQHHAEIRGWLSMRQPHNIAVGDLMRKCCCLTVVEKIRRIVFG